jgi:hypothetical protein
MPHEAPPLADDLPLGAEAMLKFIRQHTDPTSVRRTRQMTDNKVVPIPSFNLGGLTIPAAAAPLQCLEVKHWFDGR